MVKRKDGEATPVEAAKPSKSKTQKKAETTAEMIAEPKHKTIPKAKRVRKNAEENYRATSASAIPDRSILRHTMVGRWLS